MDNERTAYKARQETVILEVKRVRNSAAGPALQVP